MTYSKLYAKVWIFGNKLLIWNSQKKKKTSSNCNFQKSKNVFNVIDSIENNILK